MLCALRGRSSPQSVKVTGRIRVVIAIFLKGDGCDEWCEGVEGSSG